jgi:hypothetical protein
MTSQLTTRDVPFASPGASAHVLQLQRTSRASSVAAGSGFAESLPRAHSEVTVTDQQRAQQQRAQQQRAQQQRAQQLRCFAPMFTCLGRRTMALLKWAVIKLQKNYRMIRVQKRIRWQKVLLGLRRLKRTQDEWRQDRCPTHFLYHTSHITHHTSHITHHTSHITHHTSHITHHTSHITHHTSHITHHTSHITHHTSHITHTSFVL